MSAQDKNTAILQVTHWATYNIHKSPKILKGQCTGIEAVKG